MQRLLKYDSTFFHSFYFKNSCFYSLCCFPFLCNCCEFQISKGKLNHKRFFFFFFSVFLIWQTLLYKAYCISFKIHIFSCIPCSEIWWYFYKTLFFLELYSPWSPLTYIVCVPKKKENHMVRNSIRHWVWAIYPFNCKNCKKVI